jgi:hypothetical protein
MQLAHGLSDKLMIRLIPFWTGRRMTQYRTALWTYTVGGHFRNAETVAEFREYQEGIAPVREMSASIFDHQA